jgi:hypothetical protein
MIEYSIPCLGLGFNGSIHEIITLGYPLNLPDQTISLVFSIVIDQSIDLELIR